MLNVSAAVAVADGLGGDINNHSSLFTLEVALLETETANGTRTTFGRNLAVGMILGSIVVGAILGNILVVLSVCTNKRLRTVTNFYVVSLALSDLCVALLVMPLGIVVEITGSWAFGPIVCELWISCDVLLCTASILNLCCISLDRYFAITKPLVYATKRSRRLALTMIAIVWVSAVVITCPPIFGWREPNRHTDSNCELTKAPGYIIYSSLGSFYLPLMVMIFAYIRIFIVACRRERRFRPYYHQRSMRYTDPAPKADTSGTSECRCHHTDRESIELGDMNCDSPASTTDPGDMGGSRTALSSPRKTKNDGGGMDNGTCASCTRERGGAFKGLRTFTLCVGRNNVKLSPQPRARSNGAGSDGSELICGIVKEVRGFTNDKNGSTACNNAQTGICGGGGTTTTATLQHANRNAFTNTHAHAHITVSDSSYSSSSAATTRNPTPPKGTTGGSCSFSRTASVTSKRCGTYAVSGSNKTERGRERAVLLKEHKAAKTLAVVVGGFIACWLPFFLMYVIEPFCQTCEFNPILATFFVWLGYFNSVMNPFIYAFYNKDFRHSFWMLTIGLVCRQK